MLLDHIRIGEELIPQYYPSGINYTACNCAINNFFTGNKIDDYDGFHVNRVTSNQFNSVACYCTKGKSVLSVITGVKSSVGLNVGDMYSAIYILWYKLYSM